MIKKIFFRVIIIVLATIILSKLKLLGIMKVNALETYSVFPNTSQIFNGTELYSTANNLNSYSIFNKEFRGAQTNCTDCWHSNISFLLDYSNYQNLKSNYFSLSTIFFTNAKIIGEGYPLKAYVVDNYETSMPCNVETSPSKTELINNSGPPSIYASYISNITCPNIRVGSGGYLRLFVQGSYRVIGNAVFALSSTTIFDDKDLQNELKEISKQQKETNDLIKNSDSVSDRQINDVLESQDESDSPISDLVSMPLTLLQKINTGMNGSCSPFVLGSLLGTTLSLPCINLGTRLGTLWNIIDMCMSIFMAYAIGMMCIRIYNNFTTLKDNSNDVYGGDI